MTELVCKHWLDEHGKSSPVSLGGCCGGSALGHRRFVCVFLPLNSLCTSGHLVLPAAPEDRSAACKRYHDVKSKVLSRE